MAMMVRFFNTIYLLMVVGALYCYTINSKGMVLILQLCFDYAYNLRRRSPMLYFLPSF